MGEEAQQSVWNFDGAELYAIFEIKKAFINCLLTWDLENAYWKVRTLRMELDAKLARRKKRIVEEHEEEIAKIKGKKKKEVVLTEKETCDKKMEDLETARTIFNTSTKSQEERGEFYLVLEKFYMYLCHLMKKHGIYFREGEDMSLAVLRR